MGVEATGVAAAEVEVGEGVAGAPAPGEAVGSEATVAGRAASESYTAAVPRQRRHKVHSLHFTVLPQPPHVLFPLPFSPPHAIPPLPAPSCRLALAPPHEGSVGGVVAPLPASAARAGSPLLSAHASGTTPVAPVSSGGGNRTTATTSGEVDSGVEAGAVAETPADSGTAVVAAPAVALPW